MKNPAHSHTVHAALCDLDGIADIFECVAVATERGGIGLSHRAFLFLGAAISRIQSTLDDALDAGGSIKTKDEGDKA